MRKNFSFVAFLLGLCFLSFITGATLVGLKKFPYRAIQNACRGGKAAYEIVSGARSDRATQVWSLSRYRRRGVVRFDTAKACPGFTLYTSAHAQQAYLVAMDGRVVHRWELPFSKVWDRSAEVKKPPNDRFIYWRKAAMMPNGDLLAIYVEAGMTPWGLALVKMDRNSRPLWKYLKRAHHDFFTGTDGHVFTLTHRIVNRTLDDIPAVSPPFLEDFAVELSPGGKELKSISVYEAMRCSAFKRHLIMAPYSEKGDYLHTNTLKVADSAAALKFPFVKPGNLLLSMRDISFIGLLDTASKRFVWGTTGPWREQHDPDLLDNGHILLFDNLGRCGSPGGMSRVIEFDPLDGRIVWCYEGSEKDVFCSEVRSCQQRLPNGNTLITESGPGRLLEVTPQKEVAWEYINPAMKNNNSGLIPAACWASRIGRDEIDPDFLALLERQPENNGGGVE
jgi:hypothetical protein